MKDVSRRFRSPWPTLFHRLGFVRSFVRFRALSARHTPTSPEKACVGGAHTDTFHTR